jgi:hypothetical protein
MRGALLYLRSRGFAGRGGSAHLRVRTRDGGSDQWNHSKLQLETLVAGPVWEGALRSSHERRDE